MAEPGTPLAEHVADIATRLKEIEAERAKERQAGALPDTETLIKSVDWFCAFGWVC